MVLRRLFSCVKSVWDVGFVMRLHFQLSFLRHFLWSTHNTHCRKASIMIISSKLIYVILLCDWCNINISIARAIIRTTGCVGVETSLAKPDICLGGPLLYITHMECCFLCFSGVPWCTHQQRRYSVFTRKRSTWHLDAERSSTPHRAIVKNRVEFSIIWT